MAPGHLKFPAAAFRGKPGAFAAALCAAGEAAGEEDEEEEEEGEAAHGAAVAAAPSRAAAGTEPAGVGARCPPCPHVQVRCHRGGVHPCLPVGAWEQLPPPSPLTLRNGEGGKRVGRGGMGGKGGKRKKKKKKCRRAKNLTRPLPASKFF